MEERDKCPFNPHNVIDVVPMEDTDSSMPSGCSGGDTNQPNSNYNTPNPCRSARICNNSFVGKLKAGFGFTKGTKQFRTPKCFGMKGQARERLSRSVIVKPTQTPPVAGHQRSFSQPAHMANINSGHFDINNGFQVSATFRQTGANNGIHGNAKFGQINAQSGTQGNPNVGQFSTNNGANDITSSGQSSAVSDGQEEVTSPIKKYKTRDTRRSGFPSLPPRGENVASSCPFAQTIENRETGPTFPSLPLKPDINGAANFQFSQSSQNGKAGDKMLMDTTGSQGDAINEDTQFYNGDLETDTIVPCDVHCYPLQGKPSSIPQDFVDSNVPKTPVIEKKFLRFTLFETEAEPDQTMEILVTHADQTDTPDGDRFGATLVTFGPTKKFHFYRHFLENVTNPAKAMFIRDNDELVLINSQFVASLDHNSVLDIFRHLPVDGRTRTALIIRRAVKNTQKKAKQKLDWLWIQTSALLVPEHRHVLPPYNDHLEANDVKHGVMTAGWHQVHFHRYTYILHGQYKFMAINLTDGLQAVANQTGSTDTTFMREDYIWLENNNLHTKSALSNQEKTLYLNISDRGLVSTTAEKQYIYSVGDGKIKFWNMSDTSKALYLAYNKQTEKFEARTWRFLEKQLAMYVNEFDQHTADQTAQSEAMDFPDGARACTGSDGDDSSSDACDSGAHSLLSSQPDSTSQHDLMTSLLDSITSSQKSMKSSQNSFDSGNEDGVTAGGPDLDSNTEDVSGDNSYSSSLTTLTDSIRTPVTPMDALSLWGSKPNHFA